MSGYSGTPLSKKLGIKSNHIVSTYQSPQDYTQSLLPLPENVSIHQKLVKHADVIHAFVHSMNELTHIYPKLVSCMHKSTSLWISWPKKASKVETDLSRDIVRDFILAAGLVDVKIASYDDIYSSLKCVYRLKDR